LFSKLPRPSVFISTGLKTTKTVASRKSREKEQRQIQHSKQKREPETLKLKVVFSPETGIIDTGSFGFRIECPPTDRRSAPARVQATVPQCCCVATRDVNTQIHTHTLLLQSI
jgi:hypothetical protein